MGTFKRTTFIIINLLLGTLLTILALVFARHVPLPAGVSKGLSWLPLQSLTTAKVAPYIFWSAVVVVALLIISILVIAFYPRLYTEVALENTESGHLQIKKSAIEGYVKTLLQEEGVMPSPTVKVDMYKNRFKVRVSGRVIPRVAVPQKISLLERQIRTGLDQFFGITKKLDYQVVVNHIEPKKTATSSRVE